MAVTQIQKRQIADGAIDNAKIASGAGITSDKLADGGNFVKKDGSVSFTGAVDAGNNKVVNVATGTNTNDAVNVGQLNSAIANLNSLFDSKPSARAATTANINISNPGTATFDGVTLANGERLLVKNQTAPAENGIYVFNGSASALTRATDMDAWAEIPGALVAVEEGSTQFDTLWLCTSNQGGTLGTTAIAFTQTNAGAGLSNTNFVDKEIPSGSVNGSNTTFTLANTPVSGSEHVYLNGILQESGAGNDYTITTNSIVFAVAPLAGEKIRVSYRK